MTESYTLFLNTGNARNRVNVNSLNECTFNINWQSFLPTKYQKYEVRVTYFRNQTQVGVLTAQYSVNCFLGSKYSVDQTNNTTSLLSVFNTKTFMVDNSGTVRSSYSTPLYENVVTTIDYPTDNNITIIVSSGGVSNTFLNLTSLVFLNFTPIK
jgi:ethanolamine utilization protein EutA (predicted chaperonin)